MHKLAHICRTIARYTQQHPVVCNVIGWPVAIGLAALAITSAAHNPVVYKSYPENEILAVFSHDGRKLQPVEPQGTYTTVWVGSEVEGK